MNKMIYTIVAVLVLALLLARRIYVEIAQKHHGVRRNFRYGFYTLSFLFIAYVVFELIRGVDIEWQAFFVQIIGLLGLLIYGCGTISKGKLYIIAISLMSFINIISQMIMADEGPGLCAGVIVFPIFGIIFARIAIALREKGKEAAMQS